MGIFTDASAEIVEALGEVVTFTKLDATAIPTNAVIDRDVQAFNEYNQVLEKRTEISLLVAMVGAPEIGATITAGSEVFTVINELSNDGDVSVVAVR